MRNEEDRLGVFAETVDDILMTALANAEEEIREIDESTSESELVEVLKSANSLIRLVCGANKDLYAEWRYRLIKTGKGKYLITQGEEIDVELGDGMSMSEDLD